MNKLGQDHYLPVFIKPIKGRVLLFNPIFIKQWQMNEVFLRKLKLKPLKTPYLNCFYFDELKRPLDQEETFEVKEVLEKFCLQSISLPEKMTELEYYQLMDGNYLTVTEKLISRYVCGHVASSRHILLKDIQIKGVGRTASTHQLSYPNMNGFVQTGEAIRGYYNGQLLKTSLPFGSVNVQAILAVPDEKLHSSLVVRDALSHRIAQIEPIFLKEEDRQILKDEVNLYFPHLTKLEILERVFEQHICLWAMGVDHPMTSDNLALAGFPMDEEDMRPAHEMNGLTLDLIISVHPDEKFPLNNTESLNDAEFSMYAGICHKLNHLISWYDEALCWIKGDSPSVEIFEKNKIGIMRKVLGRFYEQEGLDCFLEIFKELSTNLRLNKTDSLQLFTKLKSAGFVISMTDSMMQVRHTVLSAKLPLIRKNDLRGRYNSIPRVETEKLVKSYGRFEMGNTGLEDESYMTNSIQLHRLVNRQAFSLASGTSLKRDDFKSYLAAQVNGFEVKELVIFCESGEKNFSYEEFFQQYNEQSEFIIIDIMIDFKGKNFAIPALKNPIIPIST